MQCANMAILNGILASLFLFFSLVLINVFQILSLILYPFSKKTFRRFNAFCAGTWWSACDLGSQKIHHTQIHLSGDLLPKKENALIIVNHQSMTDIPALFRIAKKKERIGDLKFFVKDIIKYFPGVGWGMLFLNCLFIKRDWLADEKKIFRVFKKINAEQIPLWLVTFSEGTRITPENLKKSQVYAKKNGLPLFSHVLIPRTKGFIASVRSLATHISAVYDITIAYENKNPSITQWMQGKIKNVFLDIRRFDINKLALDEESLNNWLIERFKEKDILLKGFYQSQKFPKDNYTIL